MASRITEPFERIKDRVPARRKRSKRRLIFEAFVTLLAIGLFCVKIADYADPDAFGLSVVSGQMTHVTESLSSAVDNLPFLNRCPGSLSMSDIPGGYVCVNPSMSGPYADIYKSYPLVGKGREVIYSSTDEGSASAANDLLRNVYDVARYKPIVLPRSPTWSEDPYSADYWRFEFYSLRPSLNLLYAFRTTGRTAYAKKLVQLDTSFIAAEPKSTWAWNDPHAVAFRTMSLIDTWWKLRQGHALSEQASTAMLRELEKTGNYLADPNHYQPGENHGTNEAAALYNLATAFPTLPNAHQWLQTANERFEWQLKGIIDADGQLIENSPYYDFYELEKYWLIYHYMIAQQQTPPAGFAPKLASMINFATYILQPNSQVPLLGASLAETINDHGVYATMANANANFMYVLTHGAKGSAPSANSKFFAASSLSVLRSGWARGLDYSRSTYLTYNIGRYRTAHSDLDALGITLYGDGGSLLSDPGLYEYNPGPYRNYFHGTASHNTVTVDGESQFQGNGEAGPLVTKDGITYQAGESSLYANVQHRRMVMMLDTDHILVVDQLHSATVHNYQQMFHLFPAAQLKRSGLTVTGVGGTPQRVVTIQQLKPQGISASVVINRRGNSPAGLCSQQYGQLIPCYQISYGQMARNATYATLITIGQPKQSGFSINSEAGGKRFEVTIGGRHLKISLGHSLTVAASAKATDPTPPAVRTVTVAAETDPSNWTASGDGTLVTQPSGSSQEPAVSSLAATGVASATMVNDSVRLNLRQYGARLGLRVANLSRVQSLKLSLYSDGDAHSASTDLLNNYTTDNAGQWADVYVGPGGQDGSEGGWHVSGPGFDWASVDAMSVSVETKSGVGAAPVITVGKLALLPPQQQGKLVFIFDDGYQSILPAAAYMRQHHIPGDVAVIGKYVDYPTSDYLNVFQLKSLQNNWGWNMVNHTQEHEDAVQAYYDQHNLTGYASDILQQANWLETNGLNSAPNWLIYPHGATNKALQQVVGRYYMFARGITDDPDAYPYGNPKDVSNLEIKYPGDGEGGDVGFTSPEQIISAVKSAQANRSTILLTFHRIESQPGDPPGYPLGLFKQVVDGIQTSGIKVMTLSQLDRSSGVPVKNHIYVNYGKRSQIIASIEG